MQMNRWSQASTLLLVCSCLIPMSFGQTSSSKSLTVVMENGERIFVDNPQRYQSFTASQKAEALSYLHIQEQEFLKHQQAGTLFQRPQGAMSVQVIPSTDRGDGTEVVCCGGGGGGGGGGSATTLYGYGSNNLNITAGPYSSTNVPCVSFFGITICSGAASAWAEYNTASGIIVESTAAFGIAAANANAWLGAEYISKAPSGYTSSVVAIATVYTEDETGGISGIGVSCAPLYVYESDPSGSHSDTLASCLSTLSVSIPVFDAGDAASEGEQAFTNFLDDLNNAGTIWGLLGSLPSYQTTSFTWGGSLTHGSGLAISVSPDTQAADSGAGTEVNVSRSIVQIEVIESW
jgi:hypothetical protein